MIIDKPGLYLNTTPLRIVTAAQIGTELKIIHHPLTPDQAAELGTMLLATSALERERLKAATETTEGDEAFLRAAGVRLA